MARDVYLYADESGNLDYGGLGKRGATEYFGFGTAVFYDDHGAELMEGLRLRAAVTARGISLPRGFHAVDDSHMTRNQMFAVIADQAPRFDATFLLKPNAYDWVRAMGEMRLYKLAWYLHFKAIALQVSDPADNLFVVAGTFGTKARKAQAEMALADVCGQINRNITLCVWESATSWGLQVAHYALWAVHRDLLGRPCQWFTDSIQPTLATVFTPWGVLPDAPPLPEK